MRESNSRPLAPEARIIPLDQSPIKEKKRGDARIELATSCTQNKNHTTRPITHKEKKWGDARIELATSCTLSKNHTTRPITHTKLDSTPHCSRVVPHPSTKRAQTVLTSVFR